MSKFKQTIDLMAEGSRALVLMAPLALALTSLGCSGLAVKPPPVSVPPEPDAPAPVAAPVTASPEELSSEPSAVEDSSVELAEDGGGAAQVGAGATAETAGAKVAEAAPVEPSESIGSDGAQVPAAEPEVAEPSLPQPPPSPPTAPPEPPKTLGFDVPDNPQIAALVKEFTNGSGRDAVAKGLERARVYRGYMVEVLKEKGLPEGLFVLPMVESTFRPWAYSHAGAAGMWQFIDSTARLSGLRVDWWVDERLDWRASTVAAADHLKELYERFRDWELALAAYNAGPGGVGRAISKGGAADFWVLSEKKLLRSETRRYVPKFYALVKIFADPASYGFEIPAKGEEDGLARLQVASPVALATVARIAGVGERHLERLNPALLRGCTPPGEASYVLSVPAGKGGKVAAELEKLSGMERLDFKRHKIVAGDSLWKIARRYSTRVGAITELNKLDNPKLIRPGKELVIPVGKGVVGAASQAITYADGKVHLVQKGDSLWAISRRYGVKVSSVMEWNRLASKSRIIVGDRLFVSMPVRAAPSPGNIHVVESGDTLWGISKSRGVTVAELRAWNGLSSGDMLRPGDKLRVRPVSD